MTRPMKNSEVQDELKEVFTEFDRNGDGILDANDVAQAFQLLLGDNPTLVEVEEMLREADGNGDGRRERPQAERSC